MYRAYLTSEGFCTGEPGIPARVDADYRDLEHRAAWIRLPKNSTGRDLLKLTDDSQRRFLSIVATYAAVNLYSCVPYLPAGGAMRIGDFFSASPLTLMYLGRFGNLVFYLLMVILAMRLLPKFQLPLAVLALMPMTLHQAASLSADAVTIAVSFVLTAYILRLCVDGKAAPLRRADYLWLAAALVAAGLCKASVGLVFLVLLIPAARFPERRTRWLAIAGFILLAYGTAAVWQSINRPSAEIFGTLKAAAGINLNENAAVIVHRPMAFLHAIGHTVNIWGREYLSAFVGKLGWLNIPLPDWVAWVYVTLLFLAAAVYPIEPRLSARQRILLAGIFLFNVCCLFAVVWTTELPHKVIAAELDTGALLIPGMQGRYLIPFALLLLIAVSGVLTRLRVRGFSVAALALAVLMNVVALNVLWDAFQAHSSTFPNRMRMALKLDFSDTPQAAALLYDNRLVSKRVPGETQIFLVSGGAKHIVPNSMAIARQGFKEPDDVILVSDDDLSAIPTGEPLPAPRTFEGKLVRRAGSGVEDNKVYLIIDGKKHWVWDGHWLTSHGYKWPEDVIIIPAQDLAVIPQGNSIP